MKKKTLKQLKKECNNLWREICFKRAGYKSELSGKEGRQIGGSHIIQVHHIVGKGNYRVRFELENGIVLTQWEHIKGIHGGQSEAYRAKIKEVRGNDIYDRLNYLRDK